MVVHPIKILQGPPADIKRCSNFSSKYDLALDGFNFLNLYKLICIKPVGPLFFVISMLPLFWWKKLKCSYHNSWSHGHCHNVLFISCPKKLSMLLLVLFFWPYFVYLPFVNDFSGPPKQSQQIIINNGWLFTKFFSSFSNIFLSLAPPRNSCSGIVVYTYVYIYYSIYIFC